MRGTASNSRAAHLQRAGATLVAAALLLGLVACGGGGERQDENEPAGTFPVEITTSKFATKQRLAQTSNLLLGVRNAGNEPVPNLAVTISIAGERGESSIRPFSIRERQPNLAAPDRPVWVLENNYPRLAGESTPAGAETANSKTFAFGRLAPGEKVEAVWKLTPVRPGNYTLTYRIDAGLDGKAIAETTGGSVPRGQFAVRITDVPPQTRVDDQGNVIVVKPGSPPEAPGSGGNSNGD